MKTIGGTHESAQGVLYTGSVGRMCYCSYCIAHDCREWGWFLVEEQEEKGQAWWWLAALATGGVIVLVLWGAATVGMALGGG